MRELRRMKKPYPMQKIKPRAYGGYHEHETRSTIFYAKNLQKKNIILTGRPSYDSHTSNEMTKNPKENRATIQDVDRESMQYIRIINMILPGQARTGQCSFQHPTSTLNPVCDRRQR